MTLNPAVETPATGKPGVVTGNAAGAPLGNAGSRPVTSGGTLSGAVSASAQQDANRERETRKVIMRILLQQAPISASAIAQQLGVTTAGIRRHLDFLVEDGLAEVAPIKPKAQGRGRPAKSFRLTDAGRAKFGHAYDDLAAMALSSLKEAGGDEAVAAFARKRIASILADTFSEDELQRLFTEQESSGTHSQIPDVAQRLAQAFNAHGYASEVVETEAGVQICQHHCPISQVAHEFPQLCQAEHQAIADLLDSHVQPLASIVNGNGICTTNVPLGMPQGISQGKTSATTQSKTLSKPPGPTGSAGSADFTSSAESPPADT